MKNSIYKLIIALIFISAFTSCEKDWYLKANYYIDNDTNKEFLIYLDFANNDRQKDKMCSILPNKSSQIIDSYILGGPTRDIGTSGFDIWIYNKKDSIYVKLNRDEIEIPNSIYGRVETSETKQINPLIINDFYVYINDSLISKMTKNIHLTDSVFGLKK